MSSIRKSSRSKQPLKLATVSLKQKKLAVSRSISSAVQLSQPFISSTFLGEITNTPEWKEQLYLDEYGTAEEQEHYFDEDDREPQSKPIGWCNF